MKGRNVVFFIIILVLVIILAIYFSFNYMFQRDWNGSLESLIQMVTLHRIEIGS